METLLIIFAVQGLLGAFDTLYHHELTERLPWRAAAAKELKLHGVRNFFYSIIFISLAWFAWQGVLAWIFASIFIVEIIITLMDFVEEDKSRTLPPSERITHTILALNYGCILALFAPILWQWSQQETGFLMMNFGVLSWIMTFYALGVFIWGCRDLSRGIRLSKKLPVLDDKIESIHKPNQHILVTGGTGFVGTPLCQLFIDQGHKVTILTRNMERAASLFHGRITLIDSLDKLPKDETIDIIINLAGEPISQSWSTKNKKSIRESRVKTTEKIIGLMERLTQKPSLFISGSAIGYYGVDDTQSFLEDTMPSNQAIGGFPKEICEQWESTAQKAEAFSVRTCLLRTGVVLETEGGALAQMLFPFEFGLGGKMGSGNQWFSWIHRQDFIRLIVHIINNPEIKGAINATAPTPVQNKVFCTSLGKAMHRPSTMPLPAFQVKLLFGEMGEALLLAGQKVIPQKALDSGFEFTFPTVDSALDNIFHKSRQQNST